ncbi:MAG TPA: S8 family serine peptidase, partial [Burkholderiales bacterium]|nr:S8 family serine peptidase [Burkholderiales bacterium]
MARRVAYFSVVVATVVGVVACSPGDSDKSGGNATQSAGSPQVVRHSSGLIVTREPNGSVTYQLGQPAGAATRTPRVVPGEFLVKFKPHVSRVSGMNSLSQLPLRSMRAYRSVAGLHHVRLSPGMRTEQALSAFRKSPDVEYVEPNYIVSINATPNDPSFPSQWGLHNVGQTGGTVDADVDAPEAWDITTGSSDVVVAVIDTGVDYNHQDLAANIFRNSADCNDNGIDDDGNGFIDDCHGIDTANGDSDPNDDNGHGTHVSGIIGAVGNNGIGVAGVAWNAKILPCKFLDSTGSGAIADAIACLDYVAAMKDRGVNIVASNNSWGSGFPSQALSDAIEAQMQRGILFVTAAGNAGDNNDEWFPQYPCSFDLPNILCVAATRDLNDLAFFSNFGSSTVHLAAPGMNILSTTPGNTYTTLSGTSMASPHVAGAVALVKSQDPARDWRTIKNLILAGPRSFFGSGITISERMLNLYESLSCTDSVLLARLRPLKRRNFDLHAIGDPLELSALHINCGVPAGNVTVTVSPGGETVTLVDDGTNGDKVAGDGIYTGTWTPLAAGTYSLTFPEIIDDVVTITVAPYLKRGFPAKAFFSTGRFRNGPGNHILVGNIDSDPRLEILASGIASGPLFAWHHDGRPVTGWPNFDLISAAYPSLGEFDRNSAGAEVAVNYFHL